MRLRLQAVLINIRAERRHTVLACKHVLVCIRDKGMKTWARYDGMYVRVQACQGQRVPRAHYGTHTHAHTSGATGF